MKDLLRSNLIFKYTDDYFFISCFIKLNIFLKFFIYKLKVKISNLFYLIANLTLKVFLNNYYKN